MNDFLLPVAMIIPTEIWAFDKFGEALELQQYFGNGKGSRGRVAVIQRAKLPGFLKGHFFHRYNTSYRAGPLLAQDAIPFPTLVSATRNFRLLILIFRTRSPMRMMQM